MDDLDPQLMRQLARVFARAAVDRLIGQEMREAQKARAAMEAGTSDFNDRQHDQEKGNESSKEDDQKRINST